MSNRTKSGNNFSAGALLSAGQALWYSFRSREERASAASDTGMINPFKTQRQAPISVGARYHTAGIPYLVWEVASLFDGIDGTPYAHIICVNDQTRRKTVAQSSLESGNQYVFVPPEAD